MKRHLKNVWVEECRFVSVMIRHSRLIHRNRISAVRIETLVRTVVKNAVSLLGGGYGILREKRSHSIENIISEGTENFLC